MARIRTVKPEFWTHPVMSKLSDEVRLAAIAILNIADDEGYFYAEPATLRNLVWPFDESSKKAQRILQDLSFAGWIEVKNHPTHGPIGLVVNFTKHQRVDKPSPSKIKDYYYSKNVLGTLQESSKTEQGTGNREITSVSHDKIVFDGSSFQNLNGQLKVWKEAYPAIDVEAEIKKAAAWLMANPKNKKSQYARFLNNWFSRAQDKAPRAESKPSFNGNVI